MLLSSWCNSCGPLTVQCWVIQTDAYHCSIPRGEIWTAISIQEWPCFLHPPSSPASHKHIAAGTHTWPVSLNTSSTCICSGLNQYFCGIQRGICNVKSLMLRKFWCELCKFVLHLNFSSYLTKYCEQNRPKICHQLLASLRDNTFVIRHQNVTKNTEMEETSEIFESASEIKTTEYMQLLHLYHLAHYL